MKHPSEQLLWEFIDGELPSKEAAEIRAHCARCTCCKEMLEELSAFNVGLEQTMMAYPSMRFAKNVMESVEAEVRHSEPLLKAFWMRLAVGGFATLLFALVVSACCLPTATTSNLGWIEHLSHQLTAFLPTSLAILVFTVISSFWSLFLLDRWYQVSVNSK